MNKWQWIGLLVLYVLYLLLGAAMFYFLETENEARTRDKQINEYRNITRLLNASLIVHPIELRKTLEDYCGKPMMPMEDSEIEELFPRIWNFYNAVFFVITVVSTIGYGNLHPSSAASRILMIFYAIIGIPLNGILLTSLAQFFSNVFIRAHKNYKRYESRFGLTVDILTYLVPGVLFFIFLPSVAFMYFEDWTYDESVYYAFVTLTTIGFGDIVAGQKPLELSQNVVLSYKILLLCWIVFGLGYLIMLLGFVTRAMRSKKMVRLEHKLVEALTHSKIWHGFSKDVGYLRRLMNELYLDKFKPVFHDDDSPPHKHTFYRSKSLPNIAIGLSEEVMPENVNLYKRRRANSEYSPSKIGLTRVFSENDLHRIDRRATFAAAALIQPAELLRHVVDVMGGSLCHSQEAVGADEPRGIDVFSDEEILKSERWISRSKNSISSLHHPPPYEDTLSPPRGRTRAFSESVAPLSNGHTLSSNNNLAGSEWTWSGAAAATIHDIVNERHKKNLIKQNEKKPSLLSNAKWFNPLRKKRRVNSDGAEIGDSKISISPNGDVSYVNYGDENRPKDSLPVPIDLNTKRRSLQDGKLPRVRSDAHYLTHTAGTGAQGIGLLHGRQGLSRPEQELLKLYRSGDHLFSEGTRQEILEETSLADFLRVLTSLHNRVGERLVSEDFKPKRKLGTASLTPPRISSLLDLFPPEEPAPKSPTKRKFSLMPNIFSQSSSSRRNSLKHMSPSTSDDPPAGEKPQDSSNLRRLGRFILRSHSLTPKTDSNPDVSLIHRNSYRLKKRKRGSEQQSESPLASSSNVNCPIVIQIDSPETTLKKCKEKDEPDGIVRSNTMDQILSSRLSGIRRGSSPASVIDVNPSLRDRFRPAASSESLFMMTPVGSRRVLQASPRWRPNRSQNESCSTKPGLSDVKEVIK